MDRDARVKVELSAEAVTALAGVEQIDITVIDSEGGRSAVKSVPLKQPEAVGHPDPELNGPI